MYSFVELLRAIATLLITNSHFDGVYPWNISWGGCPGVSLFFVITGFLLVKSVGKERFFQWWIRKVLRLYIPLSIVNLITVIIGFRKPSISLFLLPININLWYVPVISGLYIPYYFIVKADKDEANRDKLIGGRYRELSILIVTAIYIVLYLLKYRNEFFVEPDIMFRALYGFIGMMIGSFVFDKRNEISELGKGLLFLVFSIFCCSCFLVIKLLMNRIGIVMKLQFMTQAFGVSFAVFALLAGICFENEIQIFMKTILGKLLGIISVCSLEVYLVQFAIIGYLKGIIFPVNLILILVITVGVAYIVHIISEKISKAVIVIV